MAVAANTKRKIKDGVKGMGKHFRDFLTAAKQIGMIRSTDAIEQRLLMIQQKQLKLKAKMLEEQKCREKSTQQIKEIFDTMAKTQ